MRYLYSWRYPLDPTADPQHKRKIDRLESLNTEYYIHRYLLDMHSSLEQTSQTELH